MTEPHGSHVYRRQITQDERTSLSVLAGLVAPGSRVLDLGTGSGSLGAFLSVQKGCTCDGVTLSVEEAELAKSGYRHLEGNSDAHVKAIAAPKVTRLTTEG